MARVNGIKREAKRLNRHLTNFKSYRGLTMSPENQASNENRIAVLEKRLAEIQK